MTVGFLLDAVLDETTHISVAPELCKRVRFRKSTCQTCMDVCPDNAITLLPGPSINDNCSNCGLCQNACPTEVFQNAVNTDQVLLKQMESLLSKDQAAGKKKRLFIHCSQAEKQKKSSLAIHCLGNMTENFFLGSALSGLDEMTLTKGICSQCHLKNGEKLLESSMTTSKALAESMGLKKFIMKLQERQKRKKKEELLSRREFFTSISHKVTNSGTASILSQNESDAEEFINERSTFRDGKRPSHRRAQLRKLLRRGEQNYANGGDHHQVLPWTKMEVDKPNCTACGTCVAVCPTGALTKKFENNQVVRHLNNSLCTNCYLCQEACPESVISFEEDYAVTDLIEDKTHVVARIDMTSCVICGEIIPAGRGKTCATCEKRQISPMFMNV